jgi:hypothetical protein
MRRCPDCKRLVDADSDEWDIVKCIGCIDTAHRDEVDRKAAKWSARNRLEARFAAFDDLDGPQAA